VLTHRGRSVKTPRLEFRPFTVADAEAHEALYADPHVTRMLRGGPFLGGEVAARSALTVARFVEHWAYHGWGVWAVHERPGGAFLGQCGLNTVDALGEVEVLYALARATWGRGLATEAAGAALAYGFDVIGLRRIIALTFPHNLRSRRVMEKLGMRYDGFVTVWGIEAVRYALDVATFRARPPA
jgi:ribosomal-protein-alanine N-acetyltransferase